MMSLTLPHRLLAEMLLRWSGPMVMTDACHIWPVCVSWLPLVLYTAYVRHASVYSAEHLDAYGTVHAAIWTPRPTGCWRLVWTAAQGPVHIKCAERCLRSAMVAYVQNSTGPCRAHECEIVASAQMQRDMQPWSLCGLTAPQA